MERLIRKKEQDYSEEILNKTRINVAKYERDNEGVFIKVEIFEDEYNKQSKDYGD